MGPLLPGNGKNMIHCLVYNDGHGDVSSSTLRQHARKRLWLQYLPVTMYLRCDQSSIQYKEDLPALSFQALCDFKPVQQQAVRIMSLVLVCSL